MKILLSPAKSINESCDYTEAEFSLPAFKDEAEKLVKKLQKLKPKKIMSLMHVSADIAELNVLRYKNWYLSPTPTDSVRPAAFLFTGEVYKGLNVQEMSSKNLEAAQNQIRILSGMYGLLKPLDLIYPYRLEMGTKWDITSNTPNLYTFWGDKLTKSILAETTKEEVIVNLASTEYAKAINWKKVTRTVVTPTFKEFKNGEFKVIMIFAKHARGRMARWLVEENVQDSETLLTYNCDGYSYNSQLSTEGNPVFTR